ncbi:MAG: hypothetical protein COA91_08675 [Robiginitomaculum sp.]|nr:MAG: hypothetical protein COA91_08675 [Robiginitomaculum sp.]
MYRKLFCTLLLGAAILPTSALALTASQTVEREVIVRHADGTQTITLVQADKVTPGDKVVYSLNYYNDDDEAAENIILVMPIPNEVAYFDGSAEMESVKTTYSVDSGQTFVERASLLVTLTDGSTRRASADDITHIRWAVRDTVAPKTGGKLSFSGRLR